MRLIDADKIRYRDMSDGRVVNGVWYTFMEDIDEMPTVKAIPIEWIKIWLDKFYKNINGTRYYTGDGYDTVWDLLEDWEKENEQSNPDSR